MGTTHSIITMDPLPEYEIFRDYDGNKESKQVLDRLRRNDPALKELTLVVSGRQKVLKVFDAIATNSLLKILNIETTSLLFYDKMKNRMKRALSLNTSLNDIRIGIRIGMWDWSWSGSLLDIVMASPNLEFLTIRNYTCYRGSIKGVTAMVQVLCGHMNLHSLTFEGLQMDSDMAAAFATAFQGNQTIKTLIMGRNSVNATSAVSFVEALPHEHALEVLVFDEHEFNDASSERIVRTVCHTHLKVLSLVKSREISQKCCTRIIQTLSENEHSLTKLDLFRDSQDSMWQNFVRLEIEKLTWENHFQLEKDKWLDQFLGQHSPTKELLFLAVKRAKRLDDERFSKAPNMLFHLIKESPDFIVQAICDGHKM
jgi:hypothetical protein